MYYIIEQDYVGSTHGDGNEFILINSHEIAIFQEPMVNPRTKEAVLEGHIGTINEYSYYAIGEYATLDAAVDAVKNIGHDLREIEGSLESESDAIKSWKVGKFEKWTAEMTADWGYEYINNCEINDLVDNADEIINDLVDMAHKEEKAELDVNSIKNLISEAIEEYQEYQEEQDDGNFL